MSTQEADFLDIVRTTERCVCHFFHRDFERCKILNQHLQALAVRYVDTRFIRLSAPVSPSSEWTPTLVQFWGISNAYAQDWMLDCRARSAVEMSGDSSMIENVMTLLSSSSKLAEPYQQCLTFTACQ